MVRRGHRSSNAACLRACVGVRVLAVTVPLPSSSRPATTAPIARQIESLTALGLDVDVLGGTRETEAEVRKEHARAEGSRGASRHRPRPLRLLRLARAKPVQEASGDLVHGVRPAHAPTREQAALHAPTSSRSSSTGTLRAPQQPLSSSLRRWPVCCTRSTLTSFRTESTWSCFVRVTRDAARAFLGWEQGRTYVLFPR